MNFDPNGAAINNGNFIGLPFNEGDASTILLGIPWDVTTSYRPGTSRGPLNILKASYQLDLFDSDHHKGWQKGIFFKQFPDKWITLNDWCRKKAQAIITALENGENISQNVVFCDDLTAIDRACAELNEAVYRSCLDILQKGKKIGLIGGEHSVPLGYYRALAKQHGPFGVLQIDAHCDLRKAYEGFTYSHASIMYNALNINEVSTIVQVGIRDCCEEEIEQIENSDGRIKTYFDQQIQEQLLSGICYAEVVQEIIRQLPEKVHISFDIDGLTPDLCPNTGTPVPGGLNWEQAIFLLKAVVQSGREIIGFDVCEVAGDHDWDGNVGARIIYKLINLMTK